MHGDALTRFTEEYQARLYRQTIWPCCGKCPQFARHDARGSWSTSARRVAPLPQVQDGWNRKGLVANDGSKKQAFGVLRDAYRALAAGSR